MTVQLSSLRVVADLDVSQYVRAANQKADADGKITRSSREAGAALAAQDALAQKLGAGVQSLSRQYIDGYASAAKFEQAVAQVGRALERGMDPGRAAAALDGVYRKFGQVADATHVTRAGYVQLAPIVSALNEEHAKLSTAMQRPAASSPIAGISRDARSSQAALTNLSFQINDLATQVASGSSPLQAIAQQGGQIFQIWQESPSVFRDAGRAIGSIITPARLAGASIVGAAVTGIAAFERWQGVIRETNRALLGTGSSAGITAQRLAMMADGVAQAQGGSAGNARGTLNALANTGRIAPGMLQGIAGVQRDLAATLGMDASEANALLARSFADPVRGAEELNRILGGLDATTRAYIARLVDLGREQDAQQVVLDRVRERIGRADELTSFWARSWQSVTAAASGAADAVGRALDRMSGGGRTPQQIAFGQQSAIANDLENQKRLAEEQLRRFREFPEAAERWAQRLADVNRQLEQARSTLATMPSPATGIIDPVIVARGRQGAFERAQARRQIEDGLATSREMGAPAAASAENLERLIGQYNRLLTARRAFETEGGQSRSFASEAEAQAHIAERYRQRLRMEEDMRTARRAITDQAPGSQFSRDGELNRETALRSVLTLQQRITDEARVQRMESTATTLAEKQAAAVARERLEARKAGVQAGSDDDRRARESASTANLEVAVRHQLNVAARERIASANDNLRMVQAETQAIGASLSVQERLRIEAQMINDAKREAQRLGLTVSDAEIEQYRKLAAAMGEARQAQAVARLGNDLSFERAQMLRSPTEQRIAGTLRPIYGDDYARHMGGAEAATMRMNAALEQSISLAQGFGQSLIADLRSGKSGMDALANSVARLGDRFLQIAMDEAIRGLFGGFAGGSAGKGSGGFLGGLFSVFSAIGGLFGFGGASANGNVFGGGQIIPFAKGGAFTNGVVTRPTYFPIGLMGERGEEAIMPLKRGRDGALGVAVTGGRSASSVQVGGTTLIINGKAGPEDIAALRAELAAANQAQAAALRAAVAGEHRRAVDRELRMA